MSKPRNLSRRTSAALFASVMAASAVTVAGGAATASAAPAGADPAQVTPAEALGQHDAKLLAEAEAKNAPTVTMIVATEKGKAKEVEGDLKDLGAAVSERYDTIGYVLAKVPTSKALKAATLPGVAAVDLDEKIQLPDPKPEVVAGGKKAEKQASTLSGPGAKTPADNPYMPTGEIGAVKFVKQNPKWDGRGVTIGIMDSGVDLEHPALQKTTTGERKIVDWVTATDPFEDATWRPMITQVTGPSFTAAGRTWTAPAGTYRFNLFSESITERSEPAGDVNRDGDKTDQWGILFDPATNNIWVDTDQDGDFTDEAVMRPYKEKFDVGHLGTDNPATPVAERMSFVVEYRKNVDTTPLGGPGLVDYVNIGIIESAHGTHVAGITAANGMLGNSAFDGVAPGAKIVSSRACSWGGGCTYAALTTGMADLVINRGVDVINMSIGGLPALNDGNNARATLYNNLITTYGVQMFISAGNSGPGVNTIGDPSASSNVVSVAASVSKDTWLANYGSAVKKKNALFNFSSRGPREDGGAKPNIAAPGSAISTTPVWQAGSPVAEAGYPLPPGYSMFNGTSMASPQATGGAALLLSAGRATDQGITPAALRRAIYSSAKPIADTPTYAQGYGMFDVPGAWKLLRKSVEPNDYTSDAPVCTVLSDQLATPHRGTGVYNRCGSADGGHKVNQSKSYQVTLTRTSGPTGNIKHNVGLRGNNGTFSAPKNVTLPLNKAVTITVTAKPKTVGAHSTHRDRRRPGHQHDRLRVLRRGGGLERRQQAQLRVLGAGLGGPEQHHVVLRDGPAGRRCAPGEPLRHRHRVADPLHRDQPVGRSGGEHLQPGLLHQLRQHGRLRLVRARLRQPDAGCLGDRGGVAADLAGAEQPVPAPGAGPGRRGRPGRGRAAGGHRRLPDPGDLVAEEHLRSGLGDRTRRPAVQRAR